MEKIFTGIYDYFEKHRLALFLSFCISFLLAANFAIRVRLEEDISKILPKDKKLEKLNQVFQNSKFLDNLVVAVSLKDTSSAEPDSLVAFTSAFVKEIKQTLRPFIGKINDKVNDSLTLKLFQLVTDHLPIYLSENDYPTLDSLLNPQKIGQTLEQDLLTLSSPAGIAFKKIISIDPVGISWIGFRKIQKLQFDENLELYENYIVTKDYKHLLFFITPAYPPGNTGQNSLFLAELDKTIGRMSEENFKNIEIDYFGAAAIAAGNARQLRKDTIWTQAITILFLIVFIGFYFRKKMAAFIILVPVVFGALFSLAVIYFMKGRISVIALATGSVVFGIAVNYSLHVFNHYRQTSNGRQVIKDLAFPLTIGSFTTIGGFFCLEFVKSEMLKDLGLFAGFSLIGAALCSLIFLPHFIGSKKEQINPVAIRESWIDKMVIYNPEYNKVLLLFIAAFTIVFFFTSQKVGFETDLIHMNFMTDKLKEAEKKLDKINDYSLKSVYLVSEGKTLNEALVNNEEMMDRVEQLTSKHIIKKYAGVSSLILSDSLQKKRLEGWKKFWTEEKKTRLITTLEKKGSALKFKTSAFNPFKNLLNRDFRIIDAQEMEELKKNFAGDYITEQPGQSTVITLLKVSPENKPAVYHAFENDTHSMVVDKQYLTDSFVQVINSDFTKIALFSGILVFSVLLLTYGRIELTLVSFIPMFITFIWILGIMAIAGIQFNIINIILSALIFGLGDDYSLFIMDGLLGQYKSGKKNLSSFKSSIILSAITTVAGLGVLIFARHPALKSIAVISIIGMLCVVSMAQILIPFFFAALITNRIKNNRYPWTFSSLLKSVFAFTYFILGSVLLTLTGFLVIKLNPFAKEKGKYFYHFMLSKFTGSLIYVMVNVKKKILNPGKEDFSKPAIVICNHQSFLDILAVVMLHPKLILLTNNWVWNSPVFGAVVRMADYYPVVAEGPEKSIELLAERIKQGYSVVVFPEGRRSVDGTIKRFHKGAFYLAERLHIDILPIILHGTGYTMTKGDFMLKDGRITLKFLERISPDDARFGKDYTERTKQIARFFREQYRILQMETEQTVYFRERLIYNYLYKGPLIEWYLKIKLSLEKNYQLFHQLLPEKGELLDIGCGYGFMSYMLHFTSSQRKIKGIDFDEEKIEVANNCFNKNGNINFVTADIVNYPIEKSDGIILADMLHYLQPDQQEEVIEKCIQNLNPGGILVIRDGNKDLEGRHKFTRLSEFFSTKIFAFNKTAGKDLSFLSGRQIREIAFRLGMSCDEIDNTRHTSNIIFVIKHAG
jgi:uncharacterized protein